MDAPASLGAGGRDIWLARHFDGMPADATAVLLEACRAKDRLDKLDLLLSGDVDCWARVMHRTRTMAYELHIDDALAQANATAGVLTRLLEKLPQRAAPKPEADKGGGGVVVDFTSRLAHGAGASS